MNLEQKNQSLKSQAPSSKSTLNNRKQFFQALKNKSNQKNDEISLEEVKQLTKITSLSQSDSNNGNDSKSKEDKSQNNNSPSINNDSDYNPNSLKLPKKLSNESKTEFKASDEQFIKISQNQEDSKSKGDPLQYEDSASGIFDNKSEDTDDACKLGKVVKF